MKPASRLLVILALVATALWAAFPGVVAAAANPASGQEAPCPCCDDQAALASVVACPACQVGTLPGRSLAIATAAVTAPWLAIAPASAFGIDPAPAEPPPR